MPSLPDLVGRSVAVSGVGSAFGVAIADAFRAQGAHVYGCDLDPSGFEAPVAAGIRCSAVDLRDRAAAAGWIEAVACEAGGIDVLVNNAGGVAGQQHQPFETLSDADWDVVLDINLNAAMALSRAATRHMAAAGSGAIVNICSGASLRASLTGIQAYCAAKHGLLGLTRQLAHELGPQGIRVNAIAPGLVLTGEATLRQWDAYGPERQAAILGGVAMRRLGSAEDIARATLFLASDWAGFVTGQILSVDGGIR
ncbi:short-chain dehydrogenase [Sphingopyxis sp. Root1497]|uniref:SDR family NAD(P)-dependent oxidoreductase n=1 Tax=Sphingopyxis sp. Root1497 TaxID=1736474 RepID=UPI0006F3B855|nr:SDR family NAD(P)-dependent oxidoreductase [Sphingopyxis sp. Root1497]KQZ61573.1 short-chain dehydrogenase [Sphingopyxis sp. Root1497]